MRRIGLRRKKLGSDPIGVLYGKEVRLRRKEGGYKASEFDAHHPQGRTKKNKLFFVMIPNGLHRWIHLHPNSARAAGWLANINGTYSVSQPLIERARARYVELMKELESQ